MLQQIDQACSAAGIQPGLHLSGHAHLYERYTRTVAGKQIPYLVAGMGGYYNLPGLKPGKPAPAPSAPLSGTDASGNPLRLEVYNDATFGFLRITVSPAAITGEFVTVDPSSGKTGTGDSFTLDLKTNKVSNGTTSSKGGAKGAAAKLNTSASATKAPKAASKPATAKPKSSGRKK